MDEGSMNVTPGTERWYAYGVVHKHTETCCTGRPCSQLPPSTSSGHVSSSSASASCLGMLPTGTHSLGSIASSSACELSCTCWLLPTPLTTLLHHMRSLYRRTWPWVRMQALSNYSICAMPLPTKAVWSLITISSTTAYISKQSLVAPCWQQANCSPRRHCFKETLPSFQTTQCA